MNNRALRTLILAGGKGKRLLSEQHNLPKALRLAAGEPLIAHVIRGLKQSRAGEDIGIVVGYKGQMIVDALGPGYTYMEQKEQLGTGHAVAMARDWLQDFDGDVLVVFGDMPLLSGDTYRMMVDTHQHSGAACSILSAVVDPPPAFGRIVRDGQGNFLKIVEQRDCDAATARITEVNVGVLCCDAGKLLGALSQLKNDNNQREYYLTDVPGILLAQGERVQAVPMSPERSKIEIFGVNTPEDLAFVEEMLSKGGR